MKNSIFKIFFIASSFLLTSSAFSQAWSPELLSSSFMSWGVSTNPDIPSINLLSAWKKFQKKKEVVVAVVDTGIDEPHTFLNPNIYVPTGRVTADNYGFDFSKGRQNFNCPEDKDGHGSHVSGIIKSVFPEAKVLVLKYYSFEATPQECLKSTLEALRLAVEQNVDIINYSGGGSEPDSSELSLLKAAERKGILVVAAAGNEASNIDDKKKAFYPASYGLSNIISVGAYDQAKQMASFSNWGKNTVDLMAPGYRILSSLPGGSRAGYKSGTSQATPFVTGVAALLKSQFPELRPDQIKTIIRDSAQKEMTFQGRCISGGRLDAGKAIDLAAKTLGRTLPSVDENKKEGTIHYRVNQ